jgi:hypothetical protein
VPSFHCTSSFRLASCACHHESATIATPAATPSMFISSAWRTPGCAFTTSRLALATLPPNTGHCSSTA